MTGMARAIALVMLSAVVVLPSLALAGHAGETHGQLPINWFDFSNPDTPPLIATIINFLLLVAAVYLIMRKPIGNMVRTRRDNLAAALEEARKAQAEAEAELAAARARSESLDVEMARLRQEILEAGKAEAQRIAADADQRSERMRVDTEAMIGQEVAQLAQAIRTEAVAAIVSRAESTLREKIERADHERLAREYVASMDGIAPPGGR
jgi:F-type H+-transporting ATPase subunit b